ncbi:MAG: trigger factor, partial [Acetatifactor sp.]|nr:trigger factor [Acetatifactor sp.]
GYEDALLGAEICKETDVNVTFPEDYQATELAGKAAVFKCTVKKLQEKLLPELDEEFVEEVSEESDTVEEYKEEIRKKLTDRKEADAKTAKEDAVIEAVIAGAKMDIPDAMVDTQQRQMVQDYAERLQSQGISMEQYMQFTGMTVQMLMEQVKPQALKRIQSRLVLEAVAAAEKMEASEEDFEEEAKTMGEAYKMDADKVKELLGENGKKQVMQDICVRKAVEFLVENAKEDKPAAKKSTTKKTTKKAKEEAPAEEPAAETEGEA